MSISQSFLSEDEQSRSVLVLCNYIEQPKTQMDIVEPNQTGLISVSYLTVHAENCSC